MPYKLFKRFVLGYGLSRQEGRGSLYIAVFIKKLFRIPGYLGGIHAPSLQLLLDLNPSPSTPHPLIHKVAGKPRIIEVPGLPGFLDGAFNRRRRKALAFKLVLDFLCRVVTSGKHVYQIGERDSPLKGIDVIDSLGGGLGQRIEIGLKNSPHPHGDAKSPLRPIHKG